MNTAIVSARASADLEAIHDYVARDRPVAAKRLMDTFAAKFQTLAAYPELGYRCDAVSPGLRCFAAGSYVVFYQPIEGGVQIVRVMHGSQDQTLL